MRITHLFSVNPLTFAWLTTHPYIGIQAPLFSLSTFENTCMKGFCNDELNSFS